VRSVNSNVPSAAVTTASSNVGDVTHGKPSRISRDPAGTTLRSVHVRAPDRRGTERDAPAEPGSVVARTSIRDAIFDGSSGPRSRRRIQAPSRASTNDCAGSFTRATPSAWSSAGIRPITRPSAERSSTA
jgi:hypothetical protein